MLTLVNVADEIEHAAVKNLEQLQTLTDGKGKKKEEPVVVKVEADLQPDNISEPTNV